MECETWGRWVQQVKMNSEKVKLNTEKVRVKSEKEMSD